MIVVPGVATVFAAFVVLSAVAGPQVYWTPLPELGVATNGTAVPGVHTVVFGVADRSKAAATWMVLLAFTEHPLALVTVAW